MTVGERIRSTRKSRGMTQKQLGELCGINEANIRKYELGNQNPKIETLSKIAKALNVPIATLSTWDEELNSEGRLQDEVQTIESVQSNFGEKAVTILKDFTSLNEVGQDKAVEYVSDLAEQEKYLKSSE